MTPMTLREIAEVAGGVAHGAAAVVVTGPPFLDTRTPEPGGLFVAIAGERVDGHDFAGAAAEGGAVAALGSRPTGLPTVVVDDVPRALGRLARHVLDRFRAEGDLTVLALTGSQGKTGTKDYLAQVLATAGSTVATRGNFNNELGVPLTVLRADADTRYLVVEMGARGIGHVGYLCSIAPPDVAAVLNVGSAHIGEFGSREAIAQAKGEMVEALPAHGTAVLNADDDLVSAMRTRTVASVLTWGRDDADVTVGGIEADDLGRLAFDLRHDGRTEPVRLRQPGAYQFQNAAAAAAMALAAGLDLREAAAALSAATSQSRWRMEVRERADGLVVLNDAYNANPESMESALETLMLAGRSGRRTVAVLGEMRELGEEAEAGYRRVGAHAAACGIDVLVTVGPEAEAMAMAAAGVGREVLTVPTSGREAAVEWLRGSVAAGDVILVKASRGAALEVLAEALMEEADLRDEGPSGGSAE